MLKINLLPPYINQRSKIRTAWTLLAVVLVAELIALSFYQKGKLDTESQLLSDVQTKETQVLQVQKLASEAQAERAKIQPIKDKTDFINQLFAFNKVRPDLYEHVADYIYREVWISGMQADQNVLTMPASAKSISAVGRFLLFMQNSPDFTQVRISSVPGWPPGTSGVEASPLTGASAGGGGGGPMGSGGPMMGSGGGPMGSGGPMMGSGGGPPGGPPGGESPMMGSGGGPPGGGPPGFGGSPGSAVPQIFGGEAGSGGPGLSNVPSPGQPGAEALTAGGAPIPYPSEVAQAPAPPVYFPFTVTGVLTNPINRPTFQAGGAGAADNGAGAYGSGGPGPYGSGSGGAYMSSGGPPGGPGGPAGSGGPYMSGGPPGGPK